MALRRLLNGGTVGDYRCAEMNRSQRRPRARRVGRAMAAIASEIALEAADVLNDAATAEAAERMDTSRRPDSVLRSLLRTPSDGRLHAA